ncbi:MAG: RAMP superfamily CRISPR-associated protein [Thiotrichales bacterium]
MDRINSSTFRIARFVLEAETALSISTGNYDGVFDTSLVRDANGLPAIPGSALAGVLRHLWIDSYGEDDTETANAMFGFQSRKEGSASPLTVSWGALLDENGEPAEGLLIGDKSSRLTKCELYQAVIDQADNPVLRDRVKITHRGAARKNAKFDRSILPAGHRFAAEIKLWTAKDDNGENWNKLLSLLQHPIFRLGGGTRSGLGRMKLVSLYRGEFDLTSAADIARFRKLKPGLNDIKGLEAFTPAQPQSDAFMFGTLKIQAQGPWRIGQGSESVLEDNKKPADLLPKTEERISWSGTQGKRQPRLLVLPASSLKGALAHRLSFHVRCLTGQWNTPETELSDDRPVEVDTLLGTLKAENGTGHAGRLFIDDTWQQVNTDQVTRMMHNVIDRFTGGVRNRMLFDEECLLDGNFEIPVVLDTSNLSEEAIPIIRKALKATLDDSCSGRLALGSRTSTGNGVFKGTLEGPLAGWLSTSSVEQAA